MKNLFALPMATCHCTVCLPCISCTTPQWCTEEKWRSGKDLKFLPFNCTRIPSVFNKSITLTYPRGDGFSRYKIFKRKQRNCLKKYDSAFQTLSPTSISFGFEVPNRPKYSTDWHLTSATLLQSGSVSMVFTDLHFYLNNLPGISWTNTLAILSSSTS